MGCQDRSNYAASLAGVEHVVVMPVKKANEKARGVWGPFATDGAGSCDHGTDYVGDQCLLVAAGE